MNLIYFEQITEEKGKVFSITHNFQGDETNSGILVNQVPIPEFMFGKTGEIYINPKTKELWIEYEDRPLTSEEEVAQLKAQITELEQQILILMGV